MPWRRISWVLFPFRLATKPIPQASRFLGGSAQFLHCGSCKPLLPLPPWRAAAARIFQQILLTGHETDLVY